MRTITWLLLPLALCVSSLTYAAIQARESSRLRQEVRDRRDELDDMIRTLRDGKQLLTRVPDLLPAIKLEATDLKDLVSGEAYKLGMTVSDMTPSREENARGEMEDLLRVVLRRPAHGQLVRFLTALENQARWALPRSIHIEVRDDSGDRYDEAIVVLAVPVPSPG